MASLEIQHAHRWDVTPHEAIAIQERLRAYVARQDRMGVVHTVAGIDVGFEEQGAITRAAVVVLDFPALSVQARAIARLPTSFPYIPGLLSFREVPTILEALSQLAKLPDLLICDGQGLAHPRRFGLACHLGVLCDLPALGVGKSKLVGKYEPLGAARGEQQALWDGGKVIGTVLRTRCGVKPVFVSIGHRLSLESAVAFVLKCTPKYRLPEPIRQAHRLASGK